MDENRNDENYNNNYEPNFVLRDASPTSEEGPVKSEFSSNSGMDADNAYEGLYRDPRENFKAGASASWSNGSQRSARSNAMRTSHRGERRSRPVSFTKKTLALLICGCMLFSGLFGAAGMYAGFRLGSNADASAEQEDSSLPTSGYNLENATGSNLSIQEITDKAKSSVVEIKTEAVASDSWMQEYVTEGAGSGVIISKDGYIMTNNHVIDGASKITVTTSDKKEYSAKLVGTDSTNDVAVIKIKGENLTPAVYGNSDQLKVGDMAVAIGNPLGSLGGTVTAGIISAKDRELNIDGKNMKLLQTDSSINPGNSGGGLFNGDGQLIGLVVAKSSGSDVEGLGFAIPINTAANIAQQLMDNGYVKGQPWTGMSYTEGNSNFDSVFGNSGGSVYIYSVETSASRLAGFKEGDVVYAVDGTQITSIESLSEIITKHKVGDKLKFTIVRDGQTMDLTLKLQEKTKEESSQ